LVKSLLPNRRLGLLQGLALPLDNCPADRTLTLGITFEAGFQGHVEKDQRRRNMASSCQIEQILPRLGGQRRRVNHAKPVHRKPLFQQKMQQGKGLRVEALVALVIANEGASPI
jgi:hypothetical protein